MADTHSKDLKSLEGPDDWVSLYLDGHADDMLTDLQLADLPDETTSLEDPLNLAQSEDANPLTSARLLSSDSLQHSRNSLSTEDLCLPSLDDLLADWPPRQDDSGLFSGFQRLNNTGLESASQSNELVAHSQQGSNLHSKGLADSVPELQTDSNASEGQLSTAAAHASSGESSPMTQTQSASGAKSQDYIEQQPSARATPGSTQHSAQRQSGHTQPVSPDQNALPSLVGMTAAQVAEAVGFTGSQAQQAQQAQQAKVSHAGNKSAAAHKLAVRKQANAKKKRGRDTEVPNTATASLAAGSEQQAAAVQPEPVASRAGFLGVGSNNSFGIKSKSNTGAPVAGINSNDTGVLATGVSSNNSTGAPPPGISSNNSLAVDSNNNTSAPAAGVSSNTEAMAAEPAQELSSGHSAAGDEEYQKRMARMQRNRDSAHQSRQRKRMQLEEVEQRCNQLKQHNSQLNQLVGCLTAENMTLKQQLVNVCHQTGTPLPPPPASAMPPFGFGHMGAPMLVPAPKVPIQKMPPSRPSHVPSATSSQQSSQHQAQVPGSTPAVKSRKRAKQAAGAGTVLLALFSFVVFCGPLGPFSNSTPALQPVPVGPSDHRFPTAATALVPSQAGGGHQALGGGRVLMSLEERNTTAALPASNATQLMLVTNASSSAHHPTQAASEGSGDNSAILKAAGDAEFGSNQADTTALLGVKEGSPATAGSDGGQGWWSGLLAAARVEPSKSIVLRPSNREVESQALQGLKDVAPYVLSPHQLDQGFSPARVASGQDTWQKALPAAAGQKSSGLDGLNSPNMCTEVFHFEAQEASTVQATQHVQRYLAGAGGTSMRGSGSIALPPVEGTQGVQGGKAKRQRQATIGCGEDSPDVVVSVMLPTKSDGSLDNEFTKLDQLYVVVLTPGVKYATYSCLLPKPVLV